MKNSILGSLKPVVIFSKICGTPTFIGNPVNSNSIRWIMGYIICQIPSLVCLFLNSFFNVYDLVQKKRPYFCEYFSRDELLIQKLDEKMTIETMQAQFSSDAYFSIESVMNPVFTTGVPLLFAFLFYFTGKFQNIWNFIRKIDDEITILSDGFYRKLKLRCLLLIGISLAVNYHFCSHVTVYIMLLLLFSFSGVGFIFLWTLLGA